MWRCVHALPFISVLFNTKLCTHSILDARTNCERFCYSDADSLFRAFDFSHSFGVKLFYKTKFDFGISTKPHTRPNINASHRRLCTVTLPAKHLCAPQPPPTITCANTFTLTVCVCGCAWERCAGYAIVQFVVCRINVNIADRFACVVVVVVAQNGDNDRVKLEGKKWSI